MDNNSKVELRKYQLMFLHVQDYLYKESDRFQNRNQFVTFIQTELLNKANELSTSIEDTFAPYVTPQEKLNTLNTLIQLKITERKRKTTSNNFNQEVYNSSVRFEDGGKGRGNTSSNERRLPDSRRRISRRRRK